jgi:signal peptidase I
MNMSKKTTKEFSAPKFLLDVFLDIFIVFILVVLIRTFVFAPFRVNGPSMCPTFNIYNEECINSDGEYVVASKFPTWSIGEFSFSQIERGDVVIFQAPYGDSGEYFIKRVIGIPGDIVRIEDGYVYVNLDGDFVQIDEPYLSEENFGNTVPHRTDSEEFVVPKGSYFVLGDNRTRSSDSRRCFQQLGCEGDKSPFLGHSFVQGEVKSVIFPLTHFRWIDNVEYLL